MAPQSAGRRVVIAAQSNDHSARLAGVPTERFFTDAATFARTQLLVSAYYGFDAPVDIWDAYNIEAEALGQRIVYPADGIPDADRTQPLIRTPADLDRVAPPDPYRSGRMPWVHEVNKFYLRMTGRPAHAYFCAPFSLAVNIRGYENLISDFYERPAFAHRLFSFLCDDVIGPFIEAMRAEVGNPNFLADGNDAWASPPLITLDLMDEFVVAYTNRLRERLGPKVVTRGNWGEGRSGDPERFMAQKLRCSPGFLSVLDPDLHEIGPRRVREFARSQNAFVTAGVDARLLRDGPVEAIVERIRCYIDVLARGEGRCAIFLNQIAAETPPEHVHAAVAACRAYGQLPLPDDLDDVPFTVPSRESFSAFLRDRGESID